MRALRPGFGPGAAHRRMPGGPCATSAVDALCGPCGTGGRCPAGRAGSDSCPRHDRHGAWRPGSRPLRRVPSDRGPNSRDRHRAHRHQRHRLRVGRPVRPSRVRDGRGLAHAHGLAVRDRRGAGVARAAVPAGRQAALRALPRRTLLASIGLGAFYVTNTATYYAAITTVDLSLAALIVYIYPPVVATLALLFGRPLEGRRAWTALGMAVLGVALAVGGIDPAAQPPTAGPAPDHRVAAPLLRRGSSSPHGTRASAATGSAPTRTTARTRRWSARSC